MAASFQLSVGRGTAASAALTEALQSIEVEENADGPDAMTITLPVNRTSSGDLTYVDDGTFEPYTPVSVVLTAGTSTQCVFDGYVLSWRLHLDRASADSSIRVWAQDASWLMNLNDVVREWPGHTDGAGRQRDLRLATASRRRPPTRTTTRPPTCPSSTRCSSGQPTCSSCTASRGATGSSAGSRAGTRPATAPGTSSGRSAQPPAATITLADPDDWSVDTLDLDWDVMRPTEVRASQASLVQLGRQRARDSELKRPPRPRRPGPADLRVPAVHHAADRDRRPAGAAAAHGRGARRVRLVRPLHGRGGPRPARHGPAGRHGRRRRRRGQAHSGNWFVWRVNHLIEPDSCRARFTLVRNAIGAARRHRAAVPRRHPVNGPGGYPADYPLEQERQFFYGKYRGVVSAVDADHLPDQGQGARGARRHGDGLVHAVRPLRGPAARHRVPPRGGQRGLDRVRGRRRLLSGVDRLLLARRREAAARASRRT